jgi:hypothetical protein
MTAKTLADLATEMAADFTAAANAGTSLVRKVAAFSMVYSKLHGKSLGTGLDYCQGALEGMDDFTAGYVKKCASQARHVFAHGLVNASLVKVAVLASIEEADLIAEALALVSNIDVKAAVAAGVAANAGSKGGRKPKVEITAPPAPTAPPLALPAPDHDPLLAIETTAAQAIAQLASVGATEALARLLDALIAADAAVKKAA